MGRELTGQEHKARFEQYLRVTGGVIPDAPDGPRIAAFSAMEMAQAIEREIERGRSRGQDKMRIDMDMENARQLATFLRRAVLMGA